MRGRTVAVILAILLGAPVVDARQASPLDITNGAVPLTEDLLNSSVEVVLSNGDTLRGRVIAVESDDLLLDHPALGLVRLERSAIVRILRPRPGDPEAAVLPEMPPQTAPPQVNEGPPVTQDQVAVAPTPPPSPPAATWASNVRLGLTGSRGASDSDNLRVTLAGRRATATETLDLSLEYRLGFRDDERIENRLFLRFRNDWLRSASPWTAFVRGEAEFDEFREFDARTNGGLGLGYRLIDNERTKLVADLGLGAIKEFGSMNDDIEPELITRLILQHKLNTRQDLEVSGEWFPNLSREGDYRAIVRAVWNIKLTDTGNVSLRIGATDRYDTQRTDNLNEIDYFTELQWTF